MPYDGDLTKRMELALVRIEQYSDEIKKKPEFLALPPSVREQFDRALTLSIVRLLAVNGCEPEKITPAPLRDMVEDLPIFLDEEDDESLLKAVEPSLNLLIRHLQEQKLIRNAPALLRQLRTSIPIMWETYEELDEDYRLYGDALDEEDDFVGNGEGFVQDFDRKIADIVANPLELIARLFPELDIADPDQAIQAMQKFSEYMEWRFDLDDKRRDDAKPPRRLRDVHRRMQEVEQELATSQSSSHPSHRVHIEEVDSIPSRTDSSLGAETENDMLTIRLEALMPQKEMPYRSPDVEQWRDLYNLSIQLRDLKPWGTLSSEDLIFIHLPDRTEPVICSIFGMGGDDLAICVYPDYQAMARGIFSLEFANILHPMMMLSHQESLVCYFGDRTELMDSDLKRIKQLGLSFRGKKNWVYFRALKPGYAPWELSMDQAELMIAVFTQLLEVTRGFQFDAPQSLDEGPPAIVRRFDSERGAWTTAVEVLPKISILTPNYTVLDELYLSRLKKLPHTSSSLEIDAFYLPMPIAEDDDSIPCYPLMLFIVDHQNGIIMDHSFVEEDESLASALLSRLGQCCEDFAPPRRILIRDGYLLGFLQHFCEKTGIVLAIDEEMPMLCSVLKDLDEKMLLS